MLERARRGLSFANVMSVLAVFIALGAGAYAALGKNSVGARQIKTEAVRAQEIKDGRVGSPELAEGAVGSGKLADGAVRGPKLATDAITADKIEDGSLHGDDIGEAEYFNFGADIGTVPAQTCDKSFVTGLPNDARDHLVLTPSHNDVTSFHLNYTAEWSDVPGEMVITTCNVSPTSVDDGTTHFNLLVLNAQ